MADLITLTAIGAGVLGGIGVLWWEQVLDTSRAILVALCAVLAYVAASSIIVAVALANVPTTSTHPVSYDYTQAANAEAAQAVQIEAAVIPAPPEITNPPLPLARPVPKFRAPRRSGASPGATVRHASQGIGSAGRPANPCPCPTAAALPPQPRPVYDYFH